MLSRVQIKIKSTSNHPISQFPFAIYRLYSSNPSPPSQPNRRRRSLFTVPSSLDRRLAKIPFIAQTADSIVLDLEDGVAFNQKQEARLKAVATLQNGDFKQAEICVRINDVSTNLFMDDLKAIVSQPRLECIVIPKVNKANDVNLISQFFRGL